MTDSSSNDDSVDAPAPLVEKGRSFSLVWVIPIVALIVGAVIGVDALRNRGIKAVITLPTGEWIEAGKTKIRYLNIEVGSVDALEVHYKPDGTGIDGVELHCTLGRDTEKYLTDGARFWVVYPRVGAGGISGLGTLVSGAYVAIQPGPVDGKPKREFAGLEEPPLESDLKPGITIELHAEQLHSLDVGSPVYYRDTQVGKVERHRLADDGSGVILSVFFGSPNEHLVREDSRFWNAGGIEVSGSLTNIEVTTESLDAIVEGGIAFDSPRGEKSKPAKKDSTFWLHESKGDLKSYAYRYGGLRIYAEGPSLGSVAIGDHVYYREIPVGAVVSNELMEDSKHVRIGLNIQNRYARLVRSNSIFWDASGISASLGLHGLQIHTGSFESILAGGIAFATPDSPGHLVKAGSVFELHPEVKDDWQKWSPMLWRGPPGEAPPEATKGPEKKESAIARFFHHDDKDEEKSEKDGEPEKDADQDSAHEKKRHSFFHDLFHHDKDSD